MLGINKIQNRCYVNLKASYLLTAPTPLLPHLRCQHCLLGNELEHDRKLKIPSALVERKVTFQRHESACVWCWSTLASAWNFLSNESLVARWARRTVQGTYSPVLVLPVWVWFCSESATTFTDNKLHAILGSPIFLHGTDQYFAIKHQECNMLMFQKEHIRCKMDYQRFLALNSKPRQLLFSWKVHWCVRTALVLEVLDYKICCKELQPTFRI